MNNFELCNMHDAPLRQMPNSPFCNATPFFKHPPGCGDRPILRPLMFELAGENLNYLGKK